MDESQLAIRVASPKSNVTQTIFLAMVRSHGGEWQAGPMATDEEELYRLINNLIGLERVAVFALTGLDPDRQRGAE